jgi:hypothetical protein
MLVYHHVDDTIFERQFSTYVAKLTFTKIELEPLKFDGHVATYIREFYKNTGFGKSSSKNQSIAETIITKIENENSLKDLASNHLSLLMILTVFSDSYESSKNDWNHARLFDKYTSFWLDRETSKKSSVLKNYELKKVILRELAWCKYKSIDSSSNFIDNYIDMNFTEKEISQYLSYICEKIKKEKSIKDQKSITDQENLKNIENDILNNSLLVRKGADIKYYSFFYKALQEYFVADHIFFSLTQNVNETIKSLNSVISAEIAAFLKDKIYNSSLEKKNSNNGKIERNLKNAYQKWKMENSNDYKNILVREQACHFLSRLNNKRSKEFLEKIFLEEQDQYVKRGIYIGLILFCHQKNYVEEYVKILTTGDEAKEASSINVGYYLIYYGDQFFKNDFHDERGKKCDGTIQAIMRHLKSESHEPCWAIDLITLRTLLTDSKRDAHQIMKDRNLINELKAFLTKQSKNEEKIFQNERKNLLDCLRDNGYE